MKSRRAWLSLLGFAGAVAGAAWYGSRYTPANPRTRDWYRSLRKPPFNPPNVVFAPVWTALYVLIAVSGWRASQAEPSPQRTRALALWALQLLLNAEWTHLFFGKQDPGAALADVLLLEAVILDYIRRARSSIAPPPRALSPMRPGSPSPRCSMRRFSR
jgi:benzodiazapine receptor